MKINAFTSFSMQQIFCSRVVISPQINSMTNLPRLMIEVKYPSKSFKSVYDQVVGIKNSLEDKNRVHLGVFICGVNETDQQFHKDDNLYNLIIKNQSLLFYAIVSKKNY